VSLRTVIILKSETFGDAPEELGSKLMGSFLRKLWASDEKPDAIVFYGTGVKLLVVGSHVMDALDGLFDAGVDLVACGTCAGYFKIRDAIAVGRVSDMPEIISIVMGADKVVTM
jgi:intracellular sulfur oxidation DsrE/DsrF family protein